jgi:DNA-binding NtrC family response regulator
MERHSGPLHLLVTAVAMPGMRGPSLAKRLSAANPHLRVLFMSGYTSETAEIDPSAAFIPKPFTSAGLVSKVREVLKH